MQKRTLALTSAACIAAALVFFGPASHRALAGKGDSGIAPAGYVMVGYGYGSDDKGGTIFYKPVEINIDGSADPANTLAGWLSVWCSVCGKCGDDIAAAKRVAYCPAGQVALGWIWEAWTNGGGFPDVCGSDGTPEQVAGFMYYQAVNPNTNLRTGERRPAGDYSFRGYFIGNLKIATDISFTLQPYQGIGAVHMSLADDGNVEGMWINCGTLPRIPDAASNLQVTNPVADPAKPGKCKADLSWMNGGVTNPDFLVVYVQESPAGPTHVVQPVGPYDTLLPIEDLLPSKSYIAKVRGVYNGTTQDSRSCNGLESYSEDFLTCNNGGTPVFQWVSSDEFTAPASCDVVNVCAGTIAANPVAGTICNGTNGSATIGWSITSGTNCRILRREDGGVWDAFVDDADASPSPQNDPNLKGDGNNHVYDYWLVDTSNPSVPVAQTQVAVTGLTCSPPDVCVGNYPDALCTSCVGTLTANPGGGAGCAASSGIENVQWNVAGGCQSASVYVYVDGGPGLNIGSGCSGNINYTVNTGSAYQFRLMGTCTPAPAQLLASASANTVDACAGQDPACYQCSGAYPGATCSPISPPPPVCGPVAPPASYAISYSGPGPLISVTPRKETWLKAVNPPSVPIALGGGGEFTLEFFQPFDFAGPPTCVPPLADGCKVLQGETAEYSITLNRLNGFDGTADLSAIIPGFAFTQNWPGGSTCNFNAVASCTKNVRITPDMSSAPQAYPGFFVRASGRDKVFPQRTAIVESPATTFNVWSYDFSITPQFISATLGSMLTFTITSWGINGYDKPLDYGGTIAPLTVPMPTFVAGMPATIPTPGTATFSVLANGLCNQIYTVTITGGTNLAAGAQKQRTTRFDIPNQPPVLSLQSAVCTGSPPNRRIMLTWTNAGGNTTVERSLNNFASPAESSVLISPDTGNCTDAGTLVSAGGTGVTCDGSGGGLAAITSPAQAYYYRVIGGACGVAGGYSNVVRVLSPDCKPDSAAIPPSAAITSWCSQAGTPPGVAGNVSWTFCDPDAPNWASCAAGQTTPVLAIDPQSGFCVQISSDANFSDVAFSAGANGCGNTAPCGAIGGGTGCISGEKVGSAASCAWGSSAMCMGGALTYNTPYYYRVKVKDADAWGGAEGPRWSDWSCVPPNCSAYTFRQDHYIGNIEVVAAGLRAGSPVSLGAKAILYNDDTDMPLPHPAVARALYYPPTPSDTWYFQLCDEGPFIASCSIASLSAASTSTRVTVPPPSAYAAWPVYCTSKDTVLCPIGANRPTANQGPYQTGGVKHTFPGEGMMAIAITVQDNEGHACTFEQAYQVLQHIPYWYEVVPRQ